MKIADETIRAKSKVISTPADSKDKFSLWYVSILPSMPWTIGFLNFKNSWKTSVSSCPEIWAIFSVCTGWSRKIETVFLSFDMLCKRDLERNLLILFEKIVLITKLQNATKLLPVSCSLVYLDLWKEMRETTVALERHVKT